MNLNSLWSGTDYAWFYYKKRGEEEYSDRGTRVRIIRAFKERLPGNSKDTGFADVIMIDDEGEIMYHDDGSPKTRKVRARDIGMRWEEYADERDRRRVERAKQEREWEEQRRKRNEEHARREAERERARAERLEQERLERERREALEREKRDALLNYLKELGLPHGAISNISSDSVHLTRSILEEAIEAKRNGRAAQAVTPEKRY